MGTIGKKAVWGDWKGNSMFCIGLAKKGIVDLLIEISVFC